MKTTLPKFLPFFIICFALTAPAQQHSIRNWQARATATQNAQPHWVTPLATTTPRLEQEFRTDFNRQITSAHTTTWNYDGAKGLELIPARRIRIALQYAALSPAQLPRS